MIYLIKNLLTTYSVIATTLDEVPQDTTYQVIHMPIGYKSDELKKIIDRLYYNNYEEILLENKNKFVIAMIQFKSDNTKDVLYANSYLNLLKDSVEYNKLQDSPWHHYEILNYHTGKFEVYINRDGAIEKLNQYMNEFVTEYRPNIVKEFVTSEQFLEYIK
jgi:hypothetical protein